MNFLLDRIVTGKKLLEWRILVERMESSDIWYVKVFKGIYNGLGIFYNEIMKFFIMKYMSVRLSRVILMTF